MNKLFKNNLNLSCTKLIRKDSISVKKDIKCKNMNIGIVVLNYKNYQLTSECVENLVNLGIDAHIVIIDNCSPNESYLKLKNKFDLYPYVDVLKSDKNGGYAAGNNVGARYLINQYNVDAVSILNPDIMISYNSFFENLYKKLFRDDDYAVISGICIQNEIFNMGYCCWKLPSAGELLKLRFRALHKKTRLKLPLISKVISEGLIQTDCLVGCCFMIKSKYLQQIGYFDEHTFLYNEENILGWEIKNLNKKEILSINDYFYHNHLDSDQSPKSLKDKLKNEKYDFQSTQYLLKKNYPKWSLSIYKLIHCLNIIYLSFMYLIKNKLLKK